jgi:hypothetical protein
MKTKINRKELQAKLIRIISAYVRSVTDAGSKKISKSIKKASKIIAKAVAKEKNESKAPLPPIKKLVAAKRTVKKQTKPKAIKRSSRPRFVHKIKKALPVKFIQKKDEIPVLTPEVKIEQEVI